MSLDCPELEGLAADFAARFLASGEQERNALKAQGVDLADRLRRRAIDLAQSRATEFSPAIPRYHLLAAEVALLAHGPDGAALGPFERDVYYYRAFASTAHLVDEYERFRAAYVSEDGPRTAGGSGVDQAQEEPR